MTPELHLWHRAQRTFPGLAQFDLPTPPEPYVRATLLSLHQHHEAEWLDAWQILRESDSAIVRQQMWKWMKREAPRLRAARDAAGALLWSAPAQERRAA